MSLVSLENFSNAVQVLGHLFDAMRYAPPLSDGVHAKFTIQINFDADLQPIGWWFVRDPEEEPQAHSVDYEGMTPAESAAELADDLRGRPKMNAKQRRKSRRAWTKK